MEGTPEGQAFTSRQTVLVKSLSLAEFPGEVMKQGAAEGLKSGCSVPLIAHGRPLGALAVGNSREDALTEDDVELLTQIARQVAIAVENSMGYREIEKLKNKLAEEKLYLEDEIRTECNFDEIIGVSPALKKILEQVETVASTDSNVFIRGETKIGKELIARAIHNLSRRREHTLVKINCAAIPTGLLESELFGHEKGAFTGAIERRIGRFELAHRGTLFLDEVGDIPLELQPKLLRVLQEQEFERLGSTRTQRVDVPLVAATNCELEEMVADRRFRGDLYYRLNVFPITLPPLRERQEDIPLLVRFFAQKFARRMKKPIEMISAEGSAALVRYHWPGNVLELENLIERAVILDPVGAQLEPGEILVVPSTDPGWTPLFLTAGGLVMEMGGANSHGAVVAREYGIPAVVGVRDATRRIITGQRITVDGVAGTITLVPQRCLTFASGGDNLNSPGERNAAPHPGQGRHRQNDPLPLARCPPWGCEEIQR